MENKKWFRISVILLVMFVAVSLGVFANGEQETSEDDSISIGVAMADFKIPFFVRMIKGMESEAEKLGVKIDFQDGKSDPNIQVSQIETFIIQKKDLIIVVAAQLDALVPVAKECNEAGIPIITVNRQLGEGADVLTYVGCDDFMGGEIQGELIKELLVDNGNIVLCQGSLGSSPQVLREQGLESYLKKEAPGIKIIGKQTENWDQAQAIVVVQNFLSKYKEGEIDAIVTQGPYEALGAIKAVKSSGREELLGKIVCFDLPQEVVDAITVKEIYGTVLQDPQEQGRLGVEMAVKYINGEIAKEDFEPQTWTKLPKVNVDNIQNYGAAW